MGLAISGLTMAPVGPVSRPVHPLWAGSSPHWCLRPRHRVSGELQSSDGGKAWPGVERRPRRTYGRCSREWTACPGRWVRAGLASPSPLCPP